MQKIKLLSIRQTSDASRVEVWSINNVRLAVNSGEKNYFHRKAPASFSVECGEFLRFLAMKNFFSPHSPDFLQKMSVYGFEPPTSCMPTTFLSTAPSVTYLNDNYCEFKISVEINAVNICKICYFSGEKFFLTAFCW